MSALLETKSREQKTYKGIPIRNIWVLLLYASELFAKVEHERVKRGREETPDDILEIIGEILIYFVKERIMRGLTRSSLPVQADLHRVRGSIDHLRTERRHLLSRGLIACRFEEPTLNTARNRLLKAALEKGGRIIKDKHLRKRCRDYASLLFRMGITGNLPDRTTLSKDVYGINDRDDKHAVAAAKLLLDEFIPDDTKGVYPLLSPNRTDTWLRTLFEDAVRGLLRVSAPKGWDVAPGNVGQKWPVELSSENMENFLPQMELDIVLINKAQNKKIVIDTKFTTLFKKGWYRDTSLSSAYIYQMYAYLRSQEEQGKDDSERNMNRHATGILLHPAVGDAEQHSITMQGHDIIFATVNLARNPSDIKKDILDLL